VTDSLDRPQLRPQLRTLRHWATDPLTPVLFLAVAGVVTATGAPVLTWAVVGGLAGYTLSGSV
jgi:hypothetical protein